MRLRREETNLLSVVCEELLLHYASQRGYLCFACVNHCKVSHDEVIGIGRALSKGGSPYTYLSKVLSPVEQNYKIHDKEMLAII